MGAIYYRIITLTLQPLLYLFPLTSSPFPPPNLGCWIVHPRIVQPPGRKRFASGLDLAYLKEHRGRHEPSPSIWTRVFRPLGVAIAAFIDGDFQLDVAVPVEDLRPKPTYAQITSAAAYDIRFCQMLFDEWMTKLDKSVAKLVSHLMIITGLQRQLRQARRTRASAEILS